jgi:hypothetical protein
LTLTFPKLKVLTVFATRALLVTWLVVSSLTTLIARSYHRHITACQHHTTASHLHTTGSLPFHSCPLSLPSLPPHRWAQLIYHASELDGSLAPGNRHSSYSNPPPPGPARSWQPPWHCTASEPPSLPLALSPAAPTPSHWLITPSSDIQERREAEQMMVDNCLQAGGVEPVS